MNSNIVLFALLFILLNGNVIDLTQLLLLLALLSYGCNGLFGNCCNNVQNP